MVHQKLIFERLLAPLVAPYGIGDVLLAVDVMSSVMPNAALQPYLCSLYCTHALKPLTTTLRRSKKTEGISITAIHVHMTLNGDVGDRTSLVNALHDTSNDLVRPNLVALLEALPDQRLHRCLPLNRRGDLQQRISLSHNIHTIQRQEQRESMQGVPNGSKRIIADFLKFDIIHCYYLVQQVYPSSMVSSFLQLSRKI